jgi:hypothetical protein
MGVMQGDQSPFTFRASAVGLATGRPPVPPLPGRPPVPRPGRSQLAFFAPWARGFKIADNQSPRPQDRVFYSFNDFHNLDRDRNWQLGGIYHNVNIYRELFGFEKTFWNGDASFGLRLPVNTIRADSPIRGLGGSSTAVGNLTGFTKFILWRDATYANLVSGGLAVTVPTGPTAFGGAPYAAGFRDVQLQPYLAYYFSKDRLYVQGFEAIDVPTDRRDVTMFYSDAAIGYYVYRSQDPNSWLRAVAPTAEIHVNVPLNHSGTINLSDRATVPPVVDFTFGVNAFLFQRGVLSVGVVEPVTGPRPFSYELLVLFNYYFGARSLGQMTPGPLGN